MITFPQLIGMTSTFLNVEFVALYAVTRLTAYIYDSSKGRFSHSFQSFTSLSFSLLFSFILFKAYVLHWQYLLVIFLWLICLCKHLNIHTYIYIYIHYIICINIYVYIHIHISIYMYIHIHM